MRLSLSLKLSPLILTIVEWCKMRSSIATVSMPSPAKTLSQLPKTLGEESDGGGSNDYSLSTPIEFCPTFGRVRQLKIDPPLEL